MELAIFDLDNTLIGGDSDYLWGQFLTEQGIVEKETYQRENDRFYEEYVNGTLNILEFLEFQLKPLAENDMQTLLIWRKQFLTEKIQPIMLPASIDLLNKHRDQGHTLLIITATNRFITEPIANMLGIPHLIATDAEIKNGQYTGHVENTPCFKEGKVDRLNQWLETSNMNLTTSWFYSDSHNDLPLLKQVTHPTAVDPDDTLIKHAKMKGWPIISLR